MSLPIIEKDFLWSIKLGKCLRVYSYEQPYLYSWVKFGPSDFPYPGSRIIPCATGQCVLGNPDTDGRSQFWTIPISQLLEQIKSGALIKNDIPGNWAYLKMVANRV